MSHIADKIIIRSQTTLENLNFSFPGLLNFFVDYTYNICILTINSSNRIQYILTVSLM